MSNLKTRLFDAGVLDVEEMTEVIGAVLANDEATSETVYAITDLAVARFLDLDEEGSEDFRTALRDYLRLYSFLAHVVPFASVEMETLYLYGKLLATRLPRAEGDETPDLSDAAVLTHLRLEKGEVVDGSLTGQRGGLPNRGTQRGRTR